MRPDNPVHGVTRFADGRRRCISEGRQRCAWRRARQSRRRHLAAGNCCRALPCPHGWRRGEALGLTWAALDIDRRTATLADTKTGRSLRPLSVAACNIIKVLPRTGALVFSATRGDGPMNGFPKFWARIAKLGDLPADVTPHVLRHSFASIAGDLGYSEMTIAALIGHKGQSITSRYVHSADAVLLAAADAVAERICTLFDGKRIRNHERADRQRFY